MTAGAARGSAVPDRGGRPASRSSGCSCSPTASPRSPRPTLPAVLAILQEAGVEVLVPAGEVVKHRGARAVLVGRRHGAQVRRRGPDPGPRRRRQHPARAGARGRVRARRSSASTTAGSASSPRSSARASSTTCAARWRGDFIGPRAPVAEGDLVRRRGAGGQRPRPLPQRRLADRRPHLRGRRRGGGHGPLRRGHPEHARSAPRPTTWPPAAPRCRGGCAASCSRSSRSTTWTAARW